MKKNPMVGAACGRIHPIGTGDEFHYIFTCAFGLIKCDKQ
jgi:hypothetical protein